MPRLLTRPPISQRFGFYHECAHAQIPTKNEVAANCAGLQHMRAEGLVTAEEEGTIGMIHQQEGRQRSGRRPWSALGLRPVHNSMEGRPVSRHAEDLKRLGRCRGAAVGGMTMRGYYVVVGMVVVALWGLNASRAQPERTAGLVLLTLQEAEMLRLTEEEWARPVPAERPRGPEGAPLGPHILFQTPQPQATSQGLTLATFTPTDLLVLFEKQDAEVNMESLRVLAHKGPFSKDLTERHWFRLLQINQRAALKQLFVSKISAGGRSSPPTLLKPLQALDGS
jgi:hypothetical protein